MTLPRVAVIGSCVTRDPFSRRFFPRYKSRVQLVASAYQMAFPSLMRTVPIQVQIPDTLLADHIHDVQREFAAQTFETILSSNPDAIVIDFYGDVHFGITTLDSQHVTRNHMAFPSSDAATDFFQDEGQELPYRGRFDHRIQGTGSYYELVRKSIEEFLERVHKRLPRVLLILNSSRFALTYPGEDSAMVPFPRSERLVRKNDSWASIDDLFEGMTGCLRLSYPPPLFVGNPSHPWGLNPVHYALEYYSQFWGEMATVANL